MNRSGYSEDGDQWDLIRWRGAVSQATRGARGQVFLREMLRVLDEMPDKKLIENELQSEDGVCAIGAVGRARGVDLSNLNPKDQQSVAKAFGIAWALAAEIAYENDMGAGYWYEETPERRYLRVREWVKSRINYDTDNHDPDR